MLTLETEAEAILVRRLSRCADVQFLSVLHNIRVIGKDLSKFEIMPFDYTYISCPGSLIFLNVFELFYFAVC
jgi:hypothetical protein